MLILKDFIELFKENSILTSTDCDENSPVGFISYNSQDLKSDTLFFCKGAHFKEQFLLDALKNGATAYVSEKKYNTDAPCILVSDIRKSMYLSANFMQQFSDLKFETVLGYEKMYQLYMEVKYEN